MFGEEFPDLTNKVTIKTERSLMVGSNFKIFQGEPQDDQMNCGQLIDKFDGQSEIRIL